MNITRILKNTIGTAMLAGALMLAPQAAQARVFVSVGFAPPLIPYYAQPLCPGDGYIWTPGYWAYTEDGYQWVDGAWVLAPYYGALWTPGYWGWGGGRYFWNAGYWGRNIGYYGGINYGFGYFGTGFYGGYWGGGHFFYNSAYNRVGSGFHNIYNRPVDGLGVHSGGASFARTGSFAENRGSNLGGREASVSHGVQTFAGNQGHTTYGGFANGQVSSNARESFNSRSTGSAPAAHSYAQPSYGGGQARSYSGGSQARSYSAPSGGGSSFHGSSGGGGGSHGGGGGGGGSRGGGGHR